MTNDLQSRLKDARSRVAELEAQLGESSTGSFEVEHEFLLRLLDSANVIVLILDREAKIVTFNSFLETISGYRLSEVKGRDWFETFLPPGDRGRIQAVFETAISETSTRCNINPIRTRSGDERAIEWHYTTLRDANGENEAVLSIGLDVTDRLELEQERHTLESRLQDTLTRVISGYLPICSGCKSIRNSKDEWQAIEEYVSNRTGAQFSHGLCDPCTKRLYPDFDDSADPPD